LGKNAIISTLNPKITIFKKHGKRRITNGKKRNEIKCRVVGERPEIVLIGFVHRSTGLPPALRADPFGVVWEAGREEITGASGPRGPSDPPPPSPPSRRHLFYPRDTYFWIADTYLSP
jgi:hypothetical protein